MNGKNGMNKEWNQSYKHTWITYFLNLKVTQKFRLRLRGLFLYSFYWINHKREFGAITYWENLYKQKSLSAFDISWSGSSILVEVENMLFGELIITTATSLWSTKAWIPVEKIQLPTSF